jgi:outer membrane protein assembly factor BamB
LQKKFFSNVFLITILISGLFLVASVHLSTAESGTSEDWPMYRSDPSHSGTGTGNPPLTPTILWKYTTDSPFHSSPAVVGGVVYIGSRYSNGGSFNDGSVYALNSTSGTQLWKYTTAGEIYSSPAVVGGVVYIGSNDGYVYALNSTSGTQLWKYQIGTGYCLGSATVVGGVVYIGSDIGYVYALNSTSGTQLWKYQIGSCIYSSPAVVGGVVYIGSNWGDVYALNSTSGTQLWKSPIGEIHSSPAVVGGVVYIGSYDGNVYALNSTNGVKLWNYNTGRWVPSSPAVVSGVVYIGSYDGCVYALGAPSVAVSPTSWTMDVGQSKIFTASASGGSGVYSSYQWYVGGVAQNGETAQTFIFTSDSVATYLITATVTDSLGATSTQSSATTVTITKSTYISISVDAPSVNVGSAVNIKGSLLDLFGNRLQTKIVTLSYTFAGSTSWSPISSATTNTAGEFNIQWVNTASGTFTLKAEWIGNSEFLGASNTISISFLPSENQNVFFVESNSTVTALAFNSTSSELSFAVSGTSGTTGYVKTTFAKSLIQNPENIKVYLDGNQLTYELTSNANAWLLTFTYHHSIHQVSIALTAATSTPSPSPSPSSTPAPTTSSPTVTPTSAPTATPTHTSTSSPTPPTTSSSPTTTTSPTTTVPEFPTWIILPLFLAIILLSMAFIKNRKPKK